MTEDFGSILKTDIVSEACAWIVQIEDRNLTIADQAAFKEWVNRSPVHKAEIRRLAHLSGDLNSLTDMMQPLDEAMMRHRKVRKPKIWRKRFMPILTVSVVAVFMVFFGINSGHQTSPALDTPVLYQTVVGGKQDIILTDGSVLKLNTDTEVEVDYNAERRKIRLIKGEAFFQVAHNPDRPFLVYAGDDVVRAVGTAFRVRRLDEKIEVTVTEGRVELKTEAPHVDVVILVPEKNEAEKSPIARIKPIAIGAGESITYMASVQNNTVEKISKREIERELSWQDGLLEFSETPLDEVITDLSRYTTLKIEIADPELRDLKFGGLFRTDGLSVLFDTLETDFDIEVDYAEDNVVRISRRQN